MKKTLKHKGLLLIMVMICYCYRLAVEMEAPKARDQKHQITKMVKQQRIGKTIRIGYINSTGNSDEGKPAIGGAEG